MRPCWHADRRLLASRPRETTPLCGWLLSFCTFSLTPNELTPDPWKEALPTSSSSCLEPPLLAFGHFPSLPLGVQVVAGGTSRNPQTQSGPQGRLVYAAYSLRGEGEL